MLIVNKNTFIYFGLEVEATVNTLPAGLYRAAYDYRKEQTTFTPDTQTRPYVDLGYDLGRRLDEELADFLTQPRQRGVLIHGEPGNGKTRLVSEHVGRFCREHDLVALIDPDLDYVSQVVEAIRADDKTRKIVVIFDEFDQLVDDNEHQLLRFLDGQNSIDGVMTVAMLNDLSEVPARLWKRPGRFGLVACLEQPSKDQRFRMAHSILGALDADDVALATTGLSIDYVREISERMARRGHTLTRAVDDLGLNIKNPDEDALSEAA